VSHQATYVDGLWDGRPVREWIPDVVDDVVQAIAPVRLIVFGSVARGDEKEDSDLLVIVDDLHMNERRHMMGSIRRAISAPIPIDVLVTDVVEFEARKDINGSP
jgi:predicted nucleotidyltransferase